MVDLNPLSKLSKLLLSLNPYEFTALSVILGYVFSNDLNSNEIQSLGSFFESIGQTMYTIGMQMQTLAGNGRNTTTLESNMNQNGYQDAINILKNKINNIEEIIEGLKNLNL